MQTEKEIVINLCRLVLPEEFQAQKVIISVMAPKGQQFIQKQRIIKNKGINLYRQSVFISGLQKKLAFRIYSVNESGKRFLRKELAVSEHDLSSIHNKPAMFKIEDAGFQLIWDSWIFSEESEDLNSLTDRDYSQLDLPLGNLEESDDESQTTIPFHYKQLSSTEGSWSPLSDQFPELQGKFPSTLEQNNHLKNSKRLSLLVQREKKKIKNEVYNKLIKGISGMFSNRHQSLVPK